jgi:hypothetical protein
MTAENNPDLNPVLNPDKVRQLIADAWSRLSPQDQAERNRFDIDHGIRGVTMHPDGDLIEFRRGGRTLALVHRDVLCDDGPLDVEGEFIPDNLDVQIEQLSDDDDQDD